jgi:hypothetical protein
MDFSVLQLTFLFAGVLVLISVLSGKSAASSRAFPLITLSATAVFFLV